MRRVTIEEAARCLDVNEDVVRTRIEEGQLVACQDREYKGYVWLRDIPGPTGLKAASKAPSKQRPTRAAQGPQEDQIPPANAEVGDKTESEDRKPRTSRQSPALQAPPANGGTNGKTPGRSRKPVTPQATQEVQAPTIDREAESPDLATPPKTPNRERKPRTMQQSPEVQVSPAEGGANGKSPSRERKSRTMQQSPEVQPPPAEGEVNGKTPSRSAEQSPEVQLLQETVAMLKAELGNRDRQLELKDAEIQVRREEFKELLVILQQNRALPAPAAGGSQQPTGSIVLNLKAAYSLAVARIRDATRQMLSAFPRSVFQKKSGKSVAEPVSEE